MPITYEVRDGGAFVYTRATGEVAEADLLAHQEAMLSDPRVQPGFDSLFDATMAQGIDLSKATIERMTEVDKANAEKLGRGKGALVVRSDVELAEYFEILYKGPRALVLFHNLDVALIWLGREGPSVR